MSDPQQHQRIGAVPRVDDTELQRFLQDVADALNVLPPFSTFSALTPESLVTAAAGTIAINLNPASNVTKVWIKNQGFSHTGWASNATA